MLFIELPPIGAFIVLLLIELFIDEFMVFVPFIGLLFIVFPIPFIEFPIELLME